MDRYISAQALGLPINYIELSKDIQEDICKKVIEQALSKMSVQATISQRIGVMGHVIIRSLNHAEDEELYEDCVILRDLLNILEKNYADNKTITKKKTRGHAK